MKKFLIITLFAFVIFVGIAEAGILETVKNIVTDPMRVSIYAGLGLVLAYIFKKIPNNKIQKVVGGFFRGLGKIVSCTLGKWPYTSFVYEKVLEPFFIDLIDNICATAIREFVVGLRLDNKPKEG